ncbi:hypothetical protein CVD28_05490 [Bacillus sp. M6-12]|uniref:TRAP transporter permease n=1 Tax=Bacillus sp. M6-12 TaxID=2054166 RepID=UPI000C76EADF|nr:TRAP transporter fused permease subunit [Bacillus sp. M6-12]PLS18593.1 hypothetical protein CVD28_05490 [Bacillus sp. M6-12]
MASEKTILKNSFAFFEYIYAPFKGGKSVKPSHIFVKIPIIILSTVLTLFELYVASIGSVNTLLLVAIFVACLYAIAFTTTTYSHKATNITIIDYILSLCSLGVGIYFVINQERYLSWISGISQFNTLDFIFATMLILFTLELMRRVAGIGISVVVIALLVYTFFGHLLTGTFAHREITLELFVERMFISYEGIFSAPIQVAATYAFLFVLFGKFFLYAGGGQFFFDISALIAGKKVGGPAKIAVISSGLFGTVSGSPTSDVVTTGSITIPMMKKIGYSPVYAGAVESVASTGGSILPPVMGSAVFLMAEFTGIPYGDIIQHALFMGLLYYFVVYLQVHLGSQRMGLRGLEKDQIKGLVETFKTGGQHIIPLFILVYFLLGGYTPFFVASLATLAVFIVSWFKKETRITHKKLVEIFVDTCTSMATLSVVCAAAGMVIGSINLTGLAGKFSSLIFSLSNENVFFSLVIAMFIIILLGMGMPTVSVYVLAAALVAPALIQLGLGILETHLYIIYFCVMSAITPPIAVACFAASSIAEASPMAIGLRSVRLGIVAFIMPYMFIYEPALLLLGTTTEIIMSMVTAVIGSIFLAIAMEGFFKRKLNIWARAVMLISGLLTIYPEVYSDIIGIIIGFGTMFYIYQQIKSRIYIPDIEVKG